MLACRPALVPLLDFVTGSAVSTILESRLVWAVCIAVPLTLAASVFAVVIVGTLAVTGKTGVRFDEAGSVAHMLPSILAPFPFFTFAAGATGREVCKLPVTCGVCVRPVLVGVCFVMLLVCIGWHGVGFVGLGVCLVVLGVCFFVLEG